MLILLVGPKGSGKSHVGRVLERHLGIHFFHVEPLWMRYRADCELSGRAPDVEGGIRVVHPEIRGALGRHEHVCVETTGASPEILADLLSLAPERETLVVRVAAPLALCLERVAARDPTHQIPMDVKGLAEVYEQSTSLTIAAALVLENLASSDAEIVRLVGGAVASRSIRPGQA